MRVREAGRWSWGVLVAAAVVVGGCRPAAPPAPVGTSSPPPSEDASPEEAPPTCGGAPMTAVFYDAGQALAVLLVLPDGRHVLVDTGESPSRAGCGAPCRGWNERVVNGVKADLAGRPIDMLWITHQHSDHHGGLASLVEAGVTIGTYVDNGTRLEANGVKAARVGATAAGATLHVVAPGDVEVPLGGDEEVTLAAVVPEAWPVNECDSHPNECSIGLRVDYCDSSILFTGDAEHHAEEVWPVSDVSLLQVGHHGSNTSSSATFIDKVTPEYAVISSGRRDEGTNRTYCHPIRSTVDRLTAATGGAGSRRATVFDASVRKCSQQTPEDWVTIALSDQLWLTASDHTVRLQTTGDGVFRRVVDVNTADVAELETLPGIGPVKAAAIVAHRQASGAFASSDDLLAVTGIGPATVEGLAGRVVF